MECLQPFPRWERLVWEAPQPFEMYVLSDAPHDDMESFRPPDAPSERSTGEIVACRAFHALAALFKCSVCWRCLFLYIQSRTLHKSSVCVRAIFPLGSERSWAVGLGGSVWVSSQWHRSYSLLQHFSAIQWRTLQDYRGTMCCKSTKVQTGCLFPPFWWLIILYKHSGYFSYTSRIEKCKNTI